MTDVRTRAAPTEKLDELLQRMGSLDMLAKQPTKTRAAVNYFAKL